MKSEIKKQLLTLSIGTTIAQILPLLFYPVLGRIYSPESFGVLATISSIVSVLVVISTGKYEQAILIAKSKIDVAGLIILSLGISFCFSIICFIIFVFSADYICIIFNEPSLKMWLRIIPFIALFITVYNCYNEWCVKNAYFFKLSVNKITNANTTIVSKLAYGFGKLNDGLVWGELTGRFLTAIICISFFWKYDNKSFRQISFSYIRQLFVKYIDFPKYTMPDQLLNTFGTILPVLFFSAYFGSKELGYYAMMQNILAIPAVFIGQAIMDIFRKRASIEVNITGNCHVIFMKALRVLTIVSFSVLVIFIFPLPHIFEIVLGNEWIVAGEFAQIYAPAAAIGFICNSLSGIWIVKEKMKYRFYWQLYYFGIITISLLIGCLLLKNIKLSLVLLSTGLSSAYLISIYYSWKYSK